MIKFVLVVAVVIFFLQDLVVGSGDVLLQWALEDTMPTKSADCRYSDPGGYCYLVRRALCGKVYHIDLPFSCMSPVKAVLALAWWIFQHLELRAKHQKSGKWRLFWLCTML